MATNLAHPGIADLSAPRGAVFLEQAWPESVALWARSQTEAPVGAPIWYFLEQPALFFCDADGAVALAFGSPPLVVRSVDLSLAPVIRSDLTYLKSRRHAQHKDIDRISAAQVHHAGELLLDALELLSGGLSAVLARSNQTPPAKRSPECAP